MRVYNLDGEWELSFREQDGENKDFTKVSAIVPGNTELDLSRAHFLPEDLYFGSNILECRKCEGYEWIYERTFEAKDTDGKYELRFEGVDCFADYYLNGEKIGASDNALIPHSFDVSGKIQRLNTLTVHIRSAYYEAFLHPSPELVSYSSEWQQPESRSVRKPPHCYGWDIMPRALSAGIWRSVGLIKHDECEISDFFVEEKLVSEGNSAFSVSVTTTIPPKFFLDADQPVVLTVSAACRDSHTEKSRVMRFCTETLEMGLSKTYPWWPYGYGNADLYDFTLTMTKGETLLCEKTFRHGLRTVKLDRTDSTDGVHGKFRFIVNGVEIYCTGSNWVPLDAFHSRDAQRYEKALSLFSDCGCNILRCWGGNVYEDDRFFELCDEYGIMVWQDFSMACNFYPQDKWFLETIEKEAKTIVRKLRNHCCIILWAGDNECDENALAKGVRPSDNLITRKILPEVVKYNDPTRPYLACSPYISDEVFDESLRQGRSLSYTSPENHLWGPRDYYKGPFYNNAICCFTSETGYHGCPSEKSIRRFISPDKVFPYFDNDEWTLHSTDMNGNDGRVMLMHKQIKQLFGEVPENLADYSLASQISQAEAKKFFIERMRCRRPYTSGIIWWNMLDGWPQMSDAVVDYYFEKKLAYEYIKTSQAPFSIMITEIESWNVKVLAMNSTRKDISGSFTVTDTQSGETAASGEFCCQANSNAVLSSFPVMYSEKKLFLINWRLSDGSAGKNHYIAGYPAFDFEEYKNKWLPLILGN